MGDGAVMRPVAMLSLFANLPKPPIKLYGVWQLQALISMRSLHLLLDPLYSLYGAAPDFQLLVTASLQDSFHVHL